jgi:hypothetical protein
MPNLPPARYLTAEMSCCIAAARKVARSLLRWVHLGAISSRKCQYCQNCAQLRANATAAQRDVCSTQGKNKLQNAPWRPERTAEPRKPCSEVAISFKLHDQQLLPEGQPTAEPSARI